MQIDIGEKNNGQAAMKNIQKTKPNILFVITDQQSHNMMGCAGNRYLQTPNMDYIAKKGVRFENAYCVNPICMASRFGLFTGLYPGEAKLYNNRHTQDMGVIGRILGEGLGTMLKQNGYAAAYGGKEHLPGFGAADLGFDYICPDERDGLAVCAAEYVKNAATPFFLAASFINPHDVCLMPVHDFSGVISNEEDRAIAHWAKREIESMEIARKIPENIHPEVFFECLCPPLPKNSEPAPDEPEAVAQALEERDFRKFARERYTEKDWRLHAWAYAKLTEKVDGEIGLLVKALIEANKFDDTVIIFTSDHGDIAGSHKMEGKEILFEECCRVPFVIKGLKPDFSGRVDTRLVSNGLDTIRTICDYAGLPLPRYLEESQNGGISLVPAVEENEPAKGRIIASECEYGVMATDGEYKYVRYSKGARREQFYDLKTNAGEMYDQTGQYPKEETRLKEFIDAHLEKYWK